MINALDATVEMTKANERLAETYKRLEDEEQRIIDIVRETADLRVEAMADGREKEEAIAANSYKKQLDDITASFQKNQITEYTYRQRSKHLFQIYQNELAEIAKKAAEDQLSIQEKLEKERIKKITDEYEYAKSGLEAVNEYAKRFEVTPIPVKFKLPKLKADFKLLSITSSQFSSLILNNKLSLVIPALFTRISILPNVAKVFSTNCFASSKLEASLFTANPFTPKDSTSATNSKAFCSLEWYEKATLEPCLAISKTIERPIPRLPPVIILDFPSNNLCINLKYSLY
jgi:hypothetical protein